MNGFDPGPGWREVRPAEAVVGRKYVVYSDGQRDRHWVREAPVPLLPTEPGYYVADEPGFGGTVVVELLNRPSGQWVDAGDRNYLDEETVRAMGPLVRLEPRAVTAKAVLDQVREYLGMADDDGFRDIAHEFGVQS